MSETGPDLEQYVQLVTSRADSPEDPLGLVTAAADVGRELAHAGDTVLEHFVLQAHHAGHSWTRIGERLGMTRQAARQRFGVDQMRPLRDADLELLPRLQACLDAARAAAADDSCDLVDTHHLLLGLMHVGVAASALDRLGITRPRVHDAIRTLIATPTAAGSDGTPELSDDAQRALTGARTIAAERGHGYVGTEHLLFCLATDPGSQAHRALRHLDVDTAAVKRELEGLASLRPRRIRRRKRPQACSFCGSPASSDTRLVGGPGVCICASCAHRAVSAAGAVEQ